MRARSLIVLIAVMLGGFFPVAPGYASQRDPIVACADELDRTPWLNPGLVERIELPPVGGPYDDGGISQQDLDWFRAFSDLTGHWPGIDDYANVVAVVACFERATTERSLRPPMATVVPRLIEALPPAPCDREEFAELRPGYPGYRGLVTGLLGPGDVARLCDLVAADPEFDREDEDAANRNAGKRLKLSGDPDLWTWEAWMLVEVERGLSPSCYACFLLAPVPPTSEAGAPPIAWDDPRILAGTWGASSYGALYGSEHPEAGTQAADLYTDYELRAMVILSLDYHVNAEDLLDLYEQVLDGEFTVGGSVLPVVTYWPTVVARGGYVPMPDNAHPDDQVFSVFVGAMAVTRHVPEMMQESLLSRLDRAVTEWLSELSRGRSGASFGQWLRKNGAADW